MMMFFQGLRSPSTFATATLAMAQGDSDSGSVLKLATFRRSQSDCVVGVIRGETIWALEDVASPKPAVNSMLDVIRDWESIKNSLCFDSSGHRLEDVELQAPIPRPGAIMCIGKNYRDHVKEMDKRAPGLASQDVPKNPIVFTKAPQSVVGPGAAILYPHGVSTQVDYEAELAVIIGKPGKGIKKQDAFAHVFGYTILNDVTARDLQKRHQQWFIGKSCDTFCPMGPWIVSASDVDGQDLRLQCWVNDELRQDGRTSDMIFSIGELIETISASTTLQTGDIIATGTPSGVGSGFDPPKHLTPGDTIRIKIQNIGELQNTVQ